jgi:hypothetical protein
MSGQSRSAQRKKTANELAVRQKQEEARALAADRLRSAAAAPKTESSLPSFQVCLVPCDGSALREWTIEVPTGKPEALVSCLTDRLKLHFQQTSMTDAQKVVFQEQVKAQAKKQKGAAADAANRMNAGAWDRLMAMQTVDIVPLMYNSNITDWVGVNLYVDDRGQAKQLPLNKRATALTVACGAPTQVRGDAFVARVRDDNNDLFERHDFRASEATPTAPWVATAKKVREMAAARGGSAATQAAYQLQANGQARAVQAMQPLPSTVSRAPAPLMTINERVDVLKTAVQTLARAGDEQKGGNFEAAAALFGDCCQALRPVCIDARILDAAAASDEAAAEAVKVTRPAAVVGVMISAQLKRSRCLHEVGERGATGAGDGGSAFRDAADAASEALAVVAAAGKLRAPPAGLVAARAQALRLRGVARLAEAARLEAAVATATAPPQAACDDAAEAISRLSLNPRAAADGEEDFAALAAKDFLARLKLPATTAPDEGEEGANVKALYAQAKALANRRKKRLQRAAKAEAAALEAAGGRGTSAATSNKKTKQKGKKKKKKKKR